MHLSDLTNLWIFHLNAGAPDSGPQVPEGAPWWAYVIIPALGLAGTVTTVLLSRRGGHSQAGSGGSGGHQSSGGATEAMLRQVEFARELVAELKSDRDDLTAQLADVQAHARTLEERIRQRDSRIRELVDTLDRITGRRHGP